MIQVMPFDGFESQQQLDAHQSCLVRVVLEGRDDVALFRDNWFTAHMETFEFLEAATIIDQTGCTAVPLAVEKSLSDGVPAIGILDRDVLFRDCRWADLYQLDSQLFSESTLNEHVHIASLWEIEAYLLDVDLFENVVMACHRRPPATLSQMQAALGKVLVECDFLLDSAPVYAGLHKRGEAVSPGFMWKAAFANIKEALDEKAATFDADSQTVEQAVGALVEAIKQGKPESQEERIPFLLRYVDTKRLLYRLTHVLDLRDDKDIRWTLSALQMSKNRRPAEFEAVLVHARERYAIC